MLCPKCKQEITQVRVFSECWQYAWVNSKGEIENYDSIEEILETYKIEHADSPDCYADISELICED